MRDIHVVLLFRAQRRGGNTVAEVEPSPAMPRALVLFLFCPTRRRFASRRFRMEVIHGIDQRAIVPFRHRHDGWTHDRQARFLERLTGTGCVTEACRAVVPLTRLGKVIGQRRHYSDSLLRFMIEREDRRERAMTKMTRHSDAAPTLKLATREESNALILKKLATLKAVERAEAIEFADRMDREGKAP